MDYDLLIKNGRIIDGSGSPGFRGDIGVRNGKIAQIGKLRGSAARVIDADGLAVTPGFVDNHCHYDAQVTWDPLCTFSCYHGATTVVIGNCSLALAPVRPGCGERLAEFLSYVEAIPMEALRTVDMSWETVSDYMETIDRRLGVNVGNLIGHTAVRHYVYGQIESQGRAATDSEIEAMRTVVRDSMRAGALGLSISKSKGHYDPQGTLIPAAWAEEKELFALSDVLAELGTGVIQAGAGREAEQHNRLMSRLAEATGRRVVYGTLGQLVRQPHAWKEHMAVVDENVKAGLRTHPMCTSYSITIRFTLRNMQVFRGVPTWDPIMRATHEEKLRAYRDPEIRKRLHDEAVEWKVEIPTNTIARNWYDSIWIEEPKLLKNQHLKGMTLRELATAQNKGIIDAFLDLALEEDLSTVFLQGGTNVDKDVMTRILTYPNAYIGLSDGGAHVQFRGGYSYSTRLLGYWVRSQQIMTLEQAVKKLTFDAATVFDIYDRGLLRPGLAADITIFDPDTVNPLPEDIVHDYPAGSWRTRELATGIHYTIVNGQVLLENGRHTGALPGRVLRNTLHQEQH